MTQLCKPDSPGADRLRELLDAAPFKALADPKRLTLLLELARCRELPRVGDLVKCCGVDVSVVSRHLATLRDAGVLHAEKRGREVFYHVRARALAEHLRRLADAIESCCAGQSSCCSIVQTEQESPHEPR